jgi:biotin carboxyl carrier protein
VIDVQELSATDFQVMVQGQQIDVTLSAAEDIPETVISPEIVPVREDEAPSAALFRPQPVEKLPKMVPAAHPPLPQPEKAGPGVVGAGAAAAGAGAVKAPMPGTITAVEVRAGESVKAGQVLAKLEAMKMVNAIKSPRDGIIAEVRVQTGQSVGYGHVLVTFKEA